MKRFLIALLLSVGAVGCSAKPTEPRKAPQKIQRDETCRSGYSVATGKCLDDSTAT